eukprot:486678_1
MGFKEWLKGKTPIWACGIVCCLIIWGILVFCIIEGLESMNEGNEFESGSTKEESCMIDHVELTCGNKYSEYYITVESKCGDAVIRQQDVHCEGNNDNYVLGNNYKEKEINDTYACFVYQCDTFSFEGGQSIYSYGLRWVIAGGVLIGISVFILIGVFYKFCECSSEKKTHDIINNHDTDVDEFE